MNTTENGNAKTCDAELETKTLSSSIAYKENGNLSTSLPETFRDFLARTATYSYDSMGRITSETWTAEPAMTNVPFPEDRTHSYDGLGRLSSSTIGEETHSYSYDSNGNILSKDGVTYSYDPIVRDRLLSRSDGTLMEYDSSNPGYPTRILKPGKDLSLSWKCGLLMSIGEASYSYGPSGIRVSKAVGNVSETYSLDGERILALRRIGGTHEGTLLFDHDENGRLIGFSLDGKDYVYLRNLQGDVLGILGMDGKCYVSYSYDDWGVPASKVLDLSVGPRLLELNPFLYRGCFYDRETGLYYLNSRYYDPELGRFLQAADISRLKPHSINGLNLYAYVRNDPVSFSYSDSNAIGSTGIVGGLASSTYFRSSFARNTNFDYTSNGGLRTGWLINGLDAGSTIHGLYTSISGLVNHTAYFAKNLRPFMDDMTMLGASMKDGVLAFNQFSWGLGKADIFGVALGVGIDIYDSIRREVSPGGVILGAALTATKGVGLVYLNKGILYSATTIGSAICPGIGTVVGFIIGGVVCIVVDIFVSNWLDDLIDGIAK